MRRLQWSVVVVACLALASGAASAQARRVVALPAQSVIIECDEGGTWSAIYAVEIQLVNPDDPQSVQAAQQAAEQRATAQVRRFFEREASADAVAGEIERAEVGPVGGGAALTLSQEAKARLVADIVAARRAHAPGESWGTPLLQRGVDPVKKVAWVRVGVTREPTPAVPAAPLTGGIAGALPGALPPPTAPVRVGGNIKPPAKIKDVKPIYPQSAQSDRIQGTVVIEAIIAPDGTVQSAKVLRSIPQLDQAALDAVRQWEFTPTLINGVAVPVIMTVMVNFSLQGPVGNRRNGLP